MSIECSICFEIINNNFTTSCCNQIIHEECFNGCQQINNRCPFCRKEIQIEIVPKEVELSKIICSFITCLVFLGIIFFPLVNNTVLLVKYGK